MSDIVLRVQIPAQKLQKAMRINTNETVLAFINQIFEKCPDLKDKMNYGVLLKDSRGGGKFLDESKTLASYGVDGSYRVGADTDSKKQKKLLEDIVKGNVEKLAEKTTRTTEFNFWVDATGNDIYDSQGLTPLFYACTAGNTECVLRLLLAGAQTEVYDSVGKGPVHQACLSNFDCIVLLLIDFGADLTHTNVAGNTPLHVAATRNSTESCKWLLARGADPTLKNKSGKTCLDLSQQALSSETTLLLQNFSQENSVPPPPKGNPLDTPLDVDQVVQHVLASLSECIGKEYMPGVFPNQPHNHVAKKRGEDSTPSSPSLKRVSDANARGTEGLAISPKHEMPKLPDEPTSGASTPGPGVLNTSAASTPGHASARNSAQGSGQGFGQSAQTSPGHNHAPSKPSRLSQALTETDDKDIDKLELLNSVQTDTVRRLSALATSIVYHSRPAQGLQEEPRSTKPIDPFPVLRRLKDAVTDPSLATVVDELQHALDALKPKIQELVNV